jgi:Protein of unknwon function (DUF3310)
MYSEGLCYCPHCEKNRDFIFLEVKEGFSAFKFECAWCGHKFSSKFPSSEDEKVNHPSHYQGKGIECIDVIEAFKLSFNLGNTIKYVLRAGKKGDLVEDLEKAKWYLQREINRKKDES